MAQLMLLPLTVSCFSIIQIGFTFLVPAHPGSQGKMAVKRVCVCVLTVQSSDRVSVPAIKNSAERIDNGNSKVSQHLLPNNQLLLLLI